MNHTVFLSRIWIGSNSIVRRTKILILACEQGFPGGKTNLALKQNTDLTVHPDNSGIWLKYAKQTLL